MTYVRIRSWHTVSGVSRAGVPIKTRCGRSDIEPAAPTSDHLPLDERSCELCLRLSAHDQEPRDVDNDPVPG